MVVRMAGTTGSRDRDQARAAAFLVGLAMVLGVPAGTAQAQVPGANGRIAFCGHAPDAGRGLFTMNADGSDTRRLTTGYDNHPSFSPDGSRVVFDRYASGSAVCFSDSTAGGQDVWVVSVDGSGDPINLTNDRGKVKEAFPSWSPQGDRVIFAGFQKGEGDLWMINPDGTGRTRLTSGPQDDRQPAWSPDGSRIAFIRDGDVYTMPAPGTNGSLTRLTATAAPEYIPDWAPDGSRLLIGTDEGGGEVYVINADGSGRTAVTGFPGADGAATWSPDGQQIVFDSWRDGLTQGQLFVMPSTGDAYTTHPDGTTSDAATQITNLPSGAWWADWQRIDPVVTPGCLLPPLPC